MSDGTPVQSEFCFVAEYARAHRVSPRTVLRAIKRGEIKATRLGRQWLIPASQRKVAA